MNPKRNVSAFVTDIIKNIKVLVSLFTYLKMLKLFGIDVCEPQTAEAKLKEVSLTRVIMKVIWGILFIINLFKLITNFHSHTREFLKHIIFEQCGPVCSFLIWRYLIQHEKKLKKVIKKLLQITNSSTISSIQKFIIMYYISLTPIGIISIYLHIYHIDPDTHLFDSRESLLQFRNINWYIKKSAVHLLYFAKHFTGLFVYCFLGFYMIVCRCMVIALCRHVRVNKTLLKSVTSKDIDMCFWRHYWILGTFRVLNSVLSYPVFLSNIFNICGIFYAFIMMLKWKRIDLEIFSVLILNFTAFTASTFSASAVNEADKIAKLTDVKLLQSLIVSDKQRTKGSIEIFWQMCHEPPFSLSGWNFFEYTGGFYLTAVGTMITYSLLVINL